MPQYLTKSINIPLGASEQEIKRRICKFCRITASDLLSFRLRKRSVDARDKSMVHFVCSFVVETDVLPRNARPYEDPFDVLSSALRVSASRRVVIVGAGPAGLFAATYLSKCGIDVTVIERGADISERISKVKAFFDGGDLDEECNVQYGLGGAGTFSDGKLTTGISSPFTYTVFSEFVRRGAPEDILTSALPHIGTDKLETVVANMRDNITAHGGKFMFNTALYDLAISDGSVRGVVVKRNGSVSRIPADCVILACGHSARDTFTMLRDRGVSMQFKPFAVGLRVEHPREFINKAQYGELFATHRDLTSASYKLVNNCDDGRGCYSFCMCPGGVVVAATSKRGAVVVNGMSNYDRMAPNSNSAIAVTVNAADAASFGYGDDCFAGIRFQEDLERRAYNMGNGGFVAPCQNVADFIANTPSQVADISPSYSRGVRLVNLRELLPQPLSDDIAESLTVFNRKIKGFAEHGVLLGVETRTSSPVRIVRDETYQSNVANLYPVGEGAGYAGGIVSSAVDGLKVAMAIAEKCK